jgi:CheY-like chemotaxis protein
MSRILLVEDNDMNSDMLSRRLERKGYQVISALNGLEGIQLALSEQPDIILMDMGLPLLDGWQATQQLKQTPQTRSIPILSLTAHAMMGDRKRALEAGCDEYETKPVNLPRLLTKIETLLAKNKR